MSRKPLVRAKLHRRQILASAGRAIPALAMLGLGVVVSGPARSANCMAGCVGDCTGTCGQRCADSCTATCETNCKGSCVGGSAG